MREDFILHSAGHTDGDLVCYSLDVWCEDIKHGLGLCFTNERAGWVVSFEDFEKVYLAAKKYRDSDEYKNNCRELAGLGY
jgi:hypothetical protein